MINFIKLVVIASVCIGTIWTAALFLWLAYLTRKFLAKSDKSGEIPATIQASD